LPAGFSLSLSSGKNTLLEEVAGAKGDVLPIDLIEEAKPEKIAGRVVRELTRPLV